MLSMGNNTTFKEDNMDLLIVLLLGIISSGLIVAKYQPKLSQMQEDFKNFKQDFQEHFQHMSSSEKKKFFSSLDESSRSFFEQDLFQDHIMGQMQQWQMQQHVEQFNQFAMDEGFKIVTPFDHGGYVMGNGFNPSDTMAFEASQQMDHSFNHANDSMSSFDHMNHF